MPQIPSWETRQWAAARSSGKPGSLARQSLDHDPTSVGGNVPASVGMRRITRHDPSSTGEAYMVQASVTAQLEDHDGPAAASGTKKASFKAPVYGPPVPPRYNPSENKIAVIHSRSSKYKASLARGSATGDVQESLKRLEELANTPKEIQNPVTEKHRAEIESDFCGFVSVAEPELALADMWNPDIVSKYSAMFLRARFEEAHGTKGRRHVKAVTLRGWLSLHLWNIIRHCRDEEGKKAGLQVLIKGELYPKLEQEMLSIIIEYDLERHRDPVIYFGRTEVQMMVEACLDRLEVGGLAKLQNLAILTLAFVTGLRPGSIAPTIEKYAETGKYVKLRDLTITRIGPMRFRILLHIKNWKAQNMGPIGKEEKFPLVSVEHYHNIIIDPTYHLIAYLMARGCFGPVALPEFCASEQTKIPILPEFLDEPLFVKFRSAGKEIDPNREPVSSKDLSAHVIRMAESAGLPPSGFAALRRDTGNMYGLLLGKDIGAMILGHRDNTHVFNTHYSRGLENFNFVALMSGELAGTNPMAAESQKMHDIYRISATAILHRQRMLEQMLLDSKSRPDLADSSLYKVSLSPEQRKEIQDDPSVRAHTDSLDMLWKELREITHPNAKLRQTFQGQTFAAIRDNKKRKYAWSDMERRNELVAQIEGLRKNATKARQKLSRSKNDEMKRSRRDHFEDVFEDDTYKARQDALELLNKPSHTINDRVADVIENVITHKLSKDNGGAGQRDEELPALLAEATEESASSTGTETDIEMSDHDILMSMPPLLRSHILKYRRTNEIYELIAPKDATEAAAQALRRDEQLPDPKSPAAQEDDNRGMDHDEENPLNYRMDLFACYYLQSLVGPVIAREENASKWQSKAVTETAEDNDGDAVTSYKCDKCGDRLSTPRYLQRHVEIVHSRWEEFKKQMKSGRKNKKSPWSCPSCTTKTRTFKKLQNHALNNCKKVKEHIEMLEEFETLREKWIDSRYIPVKTSGKTSQAQIELTSEVDNDSEPVLDDLELDEESASGMDGSEQSESMTDEGLEPTISELAAFVLDNQNEIIQRVSSGEVEMDPEAIDQILEGLGMFFEIAANIETEGHN